MKTKRTIRASFSAESKVLNVSLPKSWSELSQSELHGTYRIITAEEDGRDIVFSLFRLFTGIRILGRENDTFMCRITAKKGRKKIRVIFRTTPDEMAELLEPLAFVASPGDVPVRLDAWHGATAVNAQLHGVSFSDYLQLENLYQGFISTENVDALHSMAKILYPGVKTKHIDDVLTFGILQWMVQVKSLFHRMWPNFFKPAADGVSSSSMLEIMNAEIRALTGGDVTKEQMIFDTECWRALTELDFKAKEAEDMKRQLAKTKS